MSQGQVLAAELLAFTAYTDAYDALRNAQMAYNEAKRGLLAIFANDEDLPAATKQRKKPGPKPKSKQRATPAASSFKDTKEAVLYYLDAGPMTFSELRAKLIAVGHGKDTPEFSRSLGGTLNGLVRHGALKRDASGHVELMMRTRRSLHREAAHSNNGAVTV